MCALKVWGKKNPYSKQYAYVKLSVSAVPETKQSKLDKNFEIAVFKCYRIIES